MKYVTKKGQYGPLYKYTMKYHDPDSPGFGEGTWHCYAYNVEHAVEKFYDMDDGFELLTDPKRVRSKL